jgi:AP-4 complex subunit mu-1
MISNFFVLSPRGDTIIAKRYRNQGEATAHERSHTEAFFRKVKFWDDRTEAGSEQDGTSGSAADGTTEEGPSSSVSTGDAPPVFLMPDGLTYMHVKRNGLLFACSTARNVSAVTVIEVRLSSSDNNSYYCTIIIRDIARQCCA